MTMKIPLAMVAAIVAALTTACEPPAEFAASLSDPGSAAYDKRILGSWYQKFDDKPEEVLVRVLDRTAGKRLEITLLHNVDTSANFFRFEAFPSEVDGVIYYNLIRTESANTTDYTAPGEQPGHIIVRPFHLTPDVMMVCVLLWTNWHKEGDAPIRRALEGTGLTPRFASVSPRVNGKHDAHRPERALWHTLVDGGREELRRFVRKNPGRDFSPVFLLTRLGKPSPELLPASELEQLAMAHQQECNLS